MGNAKRKKSRREFLVTSSWGSLLARGAHSTVKAASFRSKGIRFGGPILEKYRSPEEWISLVKDLGYSAAYCPVSNAEDQSLIDAYLQAAKRANILIAEVGAWSNPMAPDMEERKKALEKCKTQLDLAERIHARCCVNVSGSRGNPWAGHDPRNLSEETFHLIVETTRSIIDAVRPRRTFFALETMPWAYPDTADSYLRLIKAIDRKQFAAHLDPVNLISSPQLYYHSRELLQDCFQKLGPYIRSCHAKDITMSQKQNVHLDEILIGKGNLDYRTFLQELSKLEDVPLMMEHLSSAEEYKQAAAHLRRVAKEADLQFL
jgi:sugar phosphate isomerase/epimerase